MNSLLNGKQLKLADMFFFLDEENILKVYILKNVPLIGISEKEMLDKGIKLLEFGFGTCEWLIDINRQLSLYINKRYYRDISDRRPSFKETLQKENCKTVTFEYDLLITDMQEECSRVEIITGLTIAANSYDDAILKVQEWIERTYSNFKELEWFIKDRGKMQIYNISVADFFDERDWLYCSDICKTNV